MYFCQATLGHLCLNFKRPKMSSLNRDVAPPRKSWDKNYHFVSIMQVQLNISVTKKVLPLHFC